jgi:hypothetical protein
MHVPYLCISVGVDGQQEIVFALSLKCPIELKLYRHVRNIKIGKRPFQVRLR